MSKTLKTTLGTNTAATAAWVTILTLKAPRSDFYEVISHVSYTLTGANDGAETRLLINGAATGSLGRFRGKDSASGDTNIFYTTYLKRGQTISTQQIYIAGTATAEATKSYMSIKGDSNK